MAKKSDNAHANMKKKKNKSKKLKQSGPDAIAMKQKVSKPSPFETIWSRRKFDILGKKRRGEERRVGQARSQAIDKRKKTLLKEYKQRGKASVFLDKRIGEQDVGLQEFDKAIMRSQRERQLKLKKKSKYNLSDGEEDDLEISGLGSFLGRDDFEDEVQFDDDEEELKSSADILKHVNPDNLQEPMMKGEDQEQKHRSKKEVMEEVIAKSKFFKAQKAKQKEEDEKLVEEMDREFMLLRQSPAFLSLTRTDRNDDNFLKREEIQQNSFNKLVKEMALEMRARPSDRTKTPEEIAQEQRELLEELEEERQRRMHETDDTSDEDDNDVRKGSAVRCPSIHGDDLDDSFLLEGETKTEKEWVDEIFERAPETDSESEDGEGSEDSDSAENDEEKSDKDNDETQKSSSMKDWEQSDDEGFSTDLEEDDEDDVTSAGDTDEEENKSQKRQRRAIDNASMDAKKIISGKQPTIKRDSLPFVIQAPKNYDELCLLLQNRSNNEIIEAIDRIRKCNAISLAVENRKKIQVFYGVLLQYFAVLATKKPLNVGLLNLLVKPLIQMSAEVPYFAAICARERILRTRLKLCDALKSPGQSCWPSLKTLLLLRLWSMIFPCSDFRHVVMTPAMLLMCEYLLRCPISSGRDTAIGSFLCSLVLSVIKQSQKFCPEAIMFLRAMLVAAMDRKMESCQDPQFDSVFQIQAVRPLLSMQSSIDNIDSLDFFMLMEMPEEAQFFNSDGFRAGVLITVVETLIGFVNTYEGFKSFTEIFSPISTLLLEVVKHKFLPDTIRDKFKDVAALIKAKADEHQMLRQPLQMRKKKPVPIRLLNPKFEEIYVKGRDYDPDRERAEARKLRKLIKQEARGAVSELIKDNRYIYGLKEKEKARHEEERQENYRKAKSFLEQQESDFRSGKLGKGRKRRN